MGDRTLARRLPALCWRTPPFHISWWPCRSLSRSPGLSQTFVTDSSVDSQPSPYHLLIGVHRFSVGGLLRIQLRLFWFLSLLFLELLLLPWGTRIPFLLRRFGVVSPLRPTTNHPKRVFAATSSNSFAIRSSRAIMAFTWSDPSERSILPPVTFNGRSAKCFHFNFSRLHSILGRESHSLATVQAWRATVSPSVVVTTTLTLFEAIILPPPAVVTTTFLDTPFNHRFRATPCRVSVMSLLPSNNTLSITSSLSAFLVCTRVVPFNPLSSPTVLWWVCLVAVPLLSWSNSWWRSVQWSIWHCLRNLQSLSPCLQPRQLTQSCFSQSNVFCLLLNRYGSFSSSPTDGFLHSKNSDPFLAPLSWVPHAPAEHFPWQPDRSDLTATRASFGSFHIVTNNSVLNNCIYVQGNKNNGYNLPTADEYSTTSGRGPGRSATIEG